MKTQSHSLLNRNIIGSDIHMENVKLFEHGGENVILSLWTGLNCEGRFISADFSLEHNTESYWIKLNSPFLCEGNINWTAAASKSLWTYLWRESKLRASEWMFPMTSGDWHLRGGVARRRAVKACGDNWEFCPFRVRYHICLLVWTHPVVMFIAC